MEALEPQSHHNGGQVSSYTLTEILSTMNIQLDSMSQKQASLRKSVVVEIPQLVVWVVEIALRVLHFSVRYYVISDSDLFDSINQ